VAVAKQIREVVALMWLLLILLSTGLPAELPDHPAFYDAFAFDEAILEPVRLLVSEHYLHAVDPETVISGRHQVREQPVLCENEPSVSI
jgi:hypothetical protein